VPGTHTLELSSPVDTLLLQHIAHSREGFATGALTAARWVVGKKGVFTMTDLLGI
jgi:4-hydroxy-tetrahydrodipicolinate reductase